MSGPGRRKSAGRRDVRTGSRRAAETASRHEPARARPRVPAGARRTHRGETGVALLEVVIAVSVLAIVLVGIGFELTGQIASIGSSRNEQTAEGLMSQALGEVRAMSYKTVASGLSNDDATATGTTTYITRSGTGTATWTFTDASSYQATGEPILHYTPAPTVHPPAPFYPHRTATNVVNGVTFTVLSFPTEYEVTTKVVTGVYRVTVIVTWRADGHGGPTTLAGQTLVYSSGSQCLTGTSNPYGAPCQPDFGATASAGGGSITIAPAAGAPGGQAIHGISFTTLSLLLAKTTTAGSLVQTSSIIGWAQATGAIETTGSVTLTELAKIFTAATTDPASPIGTYEHAALAQSATAIKLSAAGGDANTVTASPSPGDTGTSVSTAFAKTAQACTNLTGAGVAQDTSLPCGSEVAAQASAAGITALLYAGDTSLGNVPLATVTATATYPDRSFSARYGAQGTTCPITRTSGCVTAAAQMALGTVSLAGLPEKVLTDAKEPAGWTASKNLVSLSHYSAAVSSWSKSGVQGNHAATATSVPMSGATSPVLSYWNGSGYTSLSLPPAATKTITPTLSVTDGTLAVTVTAHLVVSPASAFSTTSTTCQRVCTAGAAVSALTGTITYLVQTGPGVVADMTLQVTLGQAVADTSYQEAS